MQSSGYDPKIHHRRSIRLPGYDYSRSGAYFVTICTHRRVHLFGDIVDGDMRLNAFGLLAKMEWQKLLHRFPSIIIDVFIIMPNHLHGILFLMDACMVGARQNTNHMADSLIFASPLRQHPPLGVIIGAYKSTTTRLINGLRHTPAQPVWQRNYYEHIIRDDQSYARIAEYILNNAQKWAGDHT